MAPRPGAASPANNLGVVAMIIAAGASILPYAIRVVLTYIQLTQPPGAITIRDAYPTIQWVLTAITGIGSIIALILAIAALKRPGSPLVPGIAIGVSAISLFGTVMSLISWSLLFISYP